MVDPTRNDSLSEVMTGNVIRTSSKASLHEAQKLLAESKLARLVVTDRHGKLYGMITHRDLVRFLSRDKSGRPLEAIPVREAMSTPALTLRPTDRIVDAARMMNRKGISSIVVTDDGNQILGIVTKTDLCFHFSLYTSKEKVKDYMTRKVFTVRPTHSIFFAASVLARQGISRVPVVDDKLTLCGMITLSDIVKSAPTMRAEPVPGKRRDRAYRGLLLPTAKLAALTASDIMTPNTVTITAEDVLSRAAELMIEHGFSGLPVIDAKRKVRGIITKTDITRAIAA
jgi:CBS domain-containing protein